MSMVFPPLPSFGIPSGVRFMSAVLSELNCKHSASYRLNLSANSGDIIYLKDYVRRQDGDGGMTVAVYNVHIMCALYSHTG